MSCRQTCNLIGLCMRAGRCAAGTEAVLEDVRRGRAEAVVISSELAENAREKLNALCRAKNVDILVIEDADGALGRCVGREGVKTLSIHDRQFACRIKESLRNEQGRTGGGA